LGHLAVSFEVCKDSASSMYIPSAILAALTITVFSGRANSRNSFSVALPPAKFETNLLADSPFGINTAFEPDTKDLLPRLEANAASWESSGDDRILPGRE
jgi:hypothetical protein